MIHIMFVCHGNICRSPMAEFVFRDLVAKKNLSNQFHICSSATSKEEIGNPVHRGTKEKLKSYNISTDGKYAIQLRKEDYQHYDYFIAMDDTNIKNMYKIFKVDDNQKIFKLLDFTNLYRDIADPWYTGNFDQTYEDILYGCQHLLDYIKKNHFSIKTMNS